MRPRETLAVAALVVAAAALRFATIDVQSFWFDESVTVHLLRLPFGDMLSRLPDTELTPPLYYVLAWPWGALFGTTELALRSLSALFGIATVPVAHLVGRELASRRAGLMLAALVAFNPVLVWYSQEGRPYALLVLTAALSLLFFTRAVRRRRARELWLWVGASILALLTHYFAAFLVVPEGLWLAWAWRPRVPALVAGGLVAAVGVALIPLAHHESAHVSAQYIQSLSLRRRLLAVPEDFVAGFVVKWDAAKETLLEAIGLAVAAAGAGIALARTDRPARRGALFAAGAALAAAGVPALLAIAGTDYLNTRNLLAACVPALAVAALGFAATRAAGVVATAALCAIGVASTIIVAADPTYQRSNWRGAAHALGPARAPRVLAVAPFEGFVDLSVYLSGLRALPPGGAAVPEVDVVTPRNPRVGGPVVARPANPLPPAAGFRLAERRYARDYTLLRWRADRPLRVTSRAVARAATGVLPAADGLLELLRPPDG